jgi:hypothetical protein
MVLTHTQYDVDSGSEKIIEPKALIALVIVLMGVCFTFLNHMVNQAYVAASPFAPASAVTTHSPDENLASQNSGSSDNYAYNPNDPAYNWQNEAQITNKQVTPPSQATPASDDDDGDAINDTANNLPDDGNPDDPPNPPDPVGDPPVDPPGDGGLGGGGGDPPIDPPDPNTII